MPSTDMNKVRDPATKQNSTHRGEGFEILCRSTELYMPDNRSTQNSISWTIGRRNSEQGRLQINRTFQVRKQVKIQTTFRLEGNLLVIETFLNRLT